MSESDETKQQNSNVSINSHIYEGHVFHKRFRPTSHALRYSVFAFLVDLADLPTLHKTLRLFSHNRWNIFSLYDCDFGKSDGLSGEKYIRAALTDMNLGSQSVSIRMLCYPRVLGYAFNPLCTYYCYLNDGRLIAVIYEVSNTFGDRQLYPFAFDSISGEFLPHHSCDKEMYVSPFTPMKMQYDFRTQIPAKDLTVAIRLYDQDGTMLTANFSGHCQSLSDRRLLRNAIVYPLMTFKVIAGIHWEALRLWIKRLPWYSYNKKMAQ